MRLAVFTKNLTNPAYAAARLGAERAAAQLGAEVLHFVPQKGDDPDEQRALIDEALALSPRPDAFVLSPVHASKVDPAIRRVAAAGIPMIGFVNPIDAAPMAAYVSSDDFQLAQGIAHYLFTHLKGQGHVLVVTGPEESFTSRERLRGFQAAASAHPGILLVGQIAGDYVREVARDRTAQWLRENVAGADACLVANDIMAIGVLDALEGAGRTAAVVGVNAIPQAIEAIAAGRMLATADFNAMQMAYLATECAVRHLRGEAIPTRVELTVQIVNQSNYAAWNLPYAQRPVITLEQLRRQK
ncbi:MAG: sugar ABC transporter substrate-binding protein [Gammaproteobacteria bacterium]|nr:sugar ABC transporter substrate-binding protein [Gammaproteobacteria bacterium]MBU0787379.1 sugar ABC transporter substrate-binding protein [Gammaproteobacteria bacterium]MBU0816464.1 sugar ABC transporter substrate-binding protein [Gammaproteobacteria bacterium]MBU1787658.1 sugar ABC transporter substrate-binding protein [Gammaproteobacteria bacterium]